FLAVGRRQQGRRQVILLPPVAEEAVAAQARERPLDRAQSQDHTTTPLQPLAALWRREPAPGAGQDRQAITVAVRQREVVVLSPGGRPRTATATAAGPCVSPRRTDHSPKSPSGWGPRDGAAHHHLAGGEARQGGQGARAVLGQ